MAFCVITDLKPDDLIMLQLMIKFYPKIPIEIVLTKIQTWEAAAGFLSKMLNHNQLSFSYFNNDSDKKPYEDLFEGHTYFKPINKFPSNDTLFEHIFVFAPLEPFITAKALDKYYPTLKHMFITVGYNTGKDKTSVEYLNDLSTQTKVILINNYASYTKVGGTIDSTHHIITKVRDFYGEKIDSIMKANQYFFVSRQTTCGTLRHLKNKALLQKLQNLLGVDKIPKTYINLFSLIDNYIHAPTFNIDAFADFVFNLCELNPTNSYLKRIHEMLTKGREKWISNIFEVEITDGQEMMVYILYDLGEIESIPCRVVLNETDELRMVKGGTNNHMLGFFDVDIDIINDRMVTSL